MLYKGNFSNITGVFIRSSRYYYSIDLFNTKKLCYYLQKVMKLHKESNS